jgi:cytochrome b561
LELDLLALGIAVVVGSVLATIPTMLFFGWLRMHLVFGVALLVLAFRLRGRLEQPRQSRAVKPWPDRRRRGANLSFPFMADSVEKVIFG